MAALLRPHGSCLHEGHCGKAACGAGGLRRREDDGGGWRKTEEDGRRWRRREEEG